MKFLLFSILTFFSTNLFSQKNTATDIWSGNYEVFTDKNMVDQFKIVKSKNLKESDVAAKYEGDLERWIIISQHDSKTDSMAVRRFLFNDEDDEYKEFGWTELHKSGKMKCLDGGHFFICQTKAKSTIELKGEKPFFTETGIFGVWLHYGLVQLRKL